MTYDVIDIIHAADILYEIKAEKQKDDTDKIVNTGSLIRWHVMMVLKGIGGKIKDKDWILFEHEKEPEIILTSQDIEEHQQAIKRMDEEHRKEIEQRQKEQQEKLEAYRNKFKKLNK